MVSVGKGWERSGSCVLGASLIIDGSLRMTDRGGTGIGKKFHVTASGVNHIYRSHTYDHESISHTSPSLTQRLSGFSTHGNVSPERKDQFFSPRSTYTWSCLKRTPKGKDFFYTVNLVSRHAKRAGQKRYMYDILHQWNLLVVIGGSLQEQKNHITRLGHDEGLPSCSNFTFAVCHW